MLSHPLQQRFTEALNSCAVHNLNDHFRSPELDTVNFLKIVTPVIFTVTVLKWKSILFSMHYASSR